MPAVVGVCERMSVSTYWLFEKMTTFRVLFSAVLLGLVMASPAQAGFILIDHFTSAAGSDGLGARSVAGTGFVGFYPSPPDPIGYVEMISGGAAATPTLTSLVYSFLPSPIVVTPVFRIRAENTQENLTETGILRARVNGGANISYTLNGNQPDYADFTFNFSSQFGPGAAVISELRVEWIRPVGDTGARQLWIDLIEVQEVPEPATLALIGLASGGGGIAAYRRRRKAVAAKK